MAGFTGRNCFGMANMPEPLRPVEPAL